MRQTNLLLLAAWLTTLVLVRYLSVHDSTNRTLTRQFARPQADEFSHIAPMSVKSECAPCRACPRFAALCPEPEKCPQPPPCPEPQPCNCPLVGKPECPSCVPNPPVAEPEPSAPPAPLAPEPVTADDAGTLDPNGMSNHEVMFEHSRVRHLFRVCNRTRLYDAANPSPDHTFRLTRPERRVISFALYQGAELQKFLHGMYRNLELAPQHYPGWMVRIYHDDSIEEGHLLTYRRMGAETILKVGTDRPEAAEGMFWRFWVAVDPTVDRYIIRDADSRLSAREAAAVQEWIASGRPFHIIRDHPGHITYPMSGGMWGGTKQNPPDFVFGSLANIINAPKNTYLSDMEFLQNVVYPIIGKQELTLEHDSFTCGSCERCENLLWRPHAIPLPTPRAGTEHVGSRYDERDRPYREDHRLLAQAFEPGCTPCWGALSRTPEMEAEVAAQLVELAQTPGGLLTAGQQRLKELQRKRIGEARHQALSRALDEAARVQSQDGGLASATRMLFAPPVSHP